MTLMLDIPEGVDMAKRVRLAVALYDAEAVSQGRAAELAGLTRTEFLEALGKAGVSPFQYTGEEAAAEASGHDSSYNRSSAKYDPSLTKEERMRLYRKWADGHPKGSPRLSDEDISREALYAGTGGDR